MKNNHIRGLIFEGISGSGKTYYLNKLLSSDFWIRKPNISSFVFSEHLTQRVLENKSALTKKDNISLLEEIISFLSFLSLNVESRGWDNETQSNHKIDFILERFHITHSLSYDYLNFDDFKEVDNSLYKLNAKICLFTVNYIALEERLFSRENSCWQNYLSQFGSSKKEVVNYFITKQENFLKLAKCSKLDYMVFDTSDSDDNILDKMISFLNSNFKRI